MRSFSAWRAAIRARLAGSLLGSWPSFPVSSRGAATHRPYRAYRPLLEARLRSIVQFSRTPRGLAVICICWVLFLVALVFAFTPRTSWVRQISVTGASSTAASPSEKSLDGWTARRLYCSAHQPCDAWSPTSADGHFGLRLELQRKEELTRC